MLLGSTASCSGPDKDYKWRVDQRIPCLEYKLPTGIRAQPEFWTLLHFAVTDPACWASCGAGNVRWRR